MKNEELKIQEILDQVAFERPQMGLFFFIEKAYYARFTIKGCRQEIGSCFRSVI